MTNRRNLWIKGFISFSILQSVMSQSHSKSPGQETGGRNWSWDLGRMIHTGLLLIMACSSCLFLHDSTTFPGLLLPIVGWSLPLQSLIKSWLQVTWWRCFLNWGCPALVTPACQISNQSVTKGESLLSTWWVLIIKLWRKYISGFYTQIKLSEIIQFLN